MFINNKKVERNPKEYQAVVEVLPEGWPFVAPLLLIFDLSQDARIQSSYASYRADSGRIMFVSMDQWSLIFDLCQVARKYRRIALHMVRTLKNEVMNLTQWTNLPYPMQKSTSLIVCKDGRGRSGQVR